jgi:ABC-type nitrate/sulfonate/bicarbonate transport system permease component
MKAKAFNRNLWASWAGVLVVLLIWQLIATFQIVDPRIFPGPLDVVHSAVAVIPVSEVLNHARASLTRVILGFAIGAFLGVLIGVASGWYRWLGKIVWSPIELLRPIPPLAWIPLALIWFGLGENSKIFIIFLGAFFPVVTNTYKGPRLLYRVALPGAMPDIATGLRIGWSLAFGSLVAAEILAAQEGLGFMIMYARELGEIGVIVYGIILIGVLSLLTDFLLYQLFLKRRLRWHFGN